VRAAHLDAVSATPGGDAACAPAGCDGKLALVEREPASTTWRDLRAAIRARFERDVATERARAEALRAEVVPAAASAVAAARVAGQCDRAWLFGSFAWGLPEERSDVDLLVEGCEEPFRLASVVGEACGRDVHVVALETAPEALRERALRDGRPL
jgi:predicted nucleotidyltransferase